MAIITRDDWGAGPNRAGAIPLPVTRLYLHHSVTPEWVGVEAARNLQNIARSRDFLDISYSWLVDVAGNQIEGRGWGRAGAHTLNWNSTSHAICLVGNFQDDVPPDAMLAGAAALVRKHAEFGPDRITHGHRDVASTSCPGQHAYARIAEINRLAELEEDDMPITPDEMDQVADRVVDLLFDRLAGDGDKATKARDKVARQILFRTRAELTLEGLPAENVNAFTAMFRSAQHAHAAHQALMQDPGEPVEPTPEPMP